MALEEQFGQVQYEDNGPNIKTIIGIILIAIGVIIAFWVLGNVYKLINNPDDFTVFEKILPKDLEDREFKIDDKTISLPEGLFNFLAYISICLLLFVVVSIAGSFIVGGVNLMQPSIQKMELKFGRKFERLNMKLDRINNNIKKLNHR